MDIQAESGTMGGTGEVIRAMWKPFVDEIRDVPALAVRHCQSLRITSVIRPECLESISAEDCNLLYLLIRHFNRQHVFEIGTYIGTSAVCMNAAVRRNGGVLTTCDPFDYAGIPPWSGIRFMQQPADLALHTLKAEGHRIDFYFIDWLPDAAAVGLLRETATDDAIFAVHDCTSSAKGHCVLDALEAAALCRGKRWFMPNATPEIMEDGAHINICTAFCVPDALIPQVSVSDH